MVRVPTGGGRASMGLMHFKPPQLAAGVSFLWGGMRGGVGPRMTHRRVGLGGNAGWRQFEGGAAWRRV